MRLLVDIEKQLGGFHLSSRFEAEDGLTGILGASGSGKSMTLKCIAGLERPSRGHIELDGVVLFDSEKKIDLPPQKRHVGYLFQSGALFPHMTVRKNILCGMRTRDGNELSRVVDLLGLAGTESLYPDQLSGGQAQRVSLARILVSHPHLLLLDEPFSALDAHLREKLQVEMKQLLDSCGCPALLVTHDRTEAYRLCGKIALMENGKMSCPRPSKQLFADPGTVQAAVLTGCKNIAPAQKSGENALLVPEWGITLKTAFPVRGDVCAVGVRAHAFSARETENRFPARLNSAIEEPFELTVPFRYAGQRDDSGSLWWRLPKSACPSGPDIPLGVRPEDVLPLYPDMKGNIP